MPVRASFIDLKIAIPAIFLIVAISQLISRVVPVGIYFSFRAFLYEGEGSNKYIALTIKLLIPAVSGFVIAIGNAFIASRSSTSDLKLHLYSTLKEGVYQSSFFCAGFFASMLQAWPQIAYWDAFADPRVYNLKPYFFGAYGLYMISFGYFCLAGGMLGASLFSGSQHELYFPGESTIRRFIVVARNGVLGFIASGLGTLLLKFLESNMAAPT
jgi:hypothetical protein